MSHQKLILIGSFVLLFFSCSNPKKGKQLVVDPEIKENLIKSPELRIILNGSWKSEETEALSAHWREFDSSKNIFRDWGINEPRPSKSSGTYELIGDTILQLSYSEYNEIERFGFDSIGQDHLDTWSYGVSAGNIIYKRTEPDVIAFDKVKLTNSVDTMFSIEILKARDQSGRHQVLVDSINSQILATFGLSDFNERQSEEFRWGDVTSSYEIKKGILYLQFTTSYYGGAYPQDYEYEIFTDLNKGEQLYYKQVAFEALFTLGGYLDFLNKYWLSGAKKKFEAAERCAGSEPLCTYYDINDYTVNNNKLSISLTKYCFPHVAQACSPDYSISIVLDSIQQYLNDMGKSILADTINFSNNPVDKMIANQKLFKNNRMSELKQNNHFIFGKIDDKYPISMAFNISLDGAVSGYYYYDKKRHKLKLQGKKQDGAISMIETVNKQQTGFFELTYSNKYELNRSFVLPSPRGKYEYLTAKWINPEKTKSFDIIISEVKSVIKN